MVCTNIPIHRKKKECNVALGQGRERQNIEEKKREPNEGKQP